MPGGQGKGNSTKKSRSSRFLIPLVVVCAVLATGISASIIYFRSAPSTQSIRTTRPVPPTQISCPKEGTARAAVTAPLVLGSHPNIVYTADFVANDTHVSELLRYDLITHKMTTILRTTKDYLSFSNAHILAGGEWIVFAADLFSAANGKDKIKIQLVRMDGQGLQTLFCLPRSTGVLNAVRIDALSLSPDGKLLAIAVLSDDDNEHSYLINLASGAVQFDEVLPQHYYASDKWQDSTHLYIRNLFSGVSQLALLDTGKGPHQQPSDLQPVFDQPNTWCWDYDPSPDGKRLFMVRCTQSQSNSSPSGPSTITVQDPMGSQIKVIYSSQNLALSQVRAVNNTTLLFNVVASASGDASQEGLWEIQTDGSSLTHLLHAPISFGDGCASRDGRFFAVSIVHGRGSTFPTYTLVVGSLQGGTPMTLPFGQNANDPHSIAGWTTM